MYTDALEFLEEERDAWAPFEALLDLPDGVLERRSDPDGPLHGWSGRELIAHLVGGQEVALQAAKELAVNEASPTIARVDAAFDADSAAFNAAMLEEWAGLSLDEVRSRARTVAGEMRGHLTVVPETRWVKHPDHMRFFAGETLEHYADHEADLAAVLAAARSRAP